jgi:putative protein-disulfide isomerase
MLAVAEKYGAEMDFQILSGGMIMGERVGAIGKVAPYIKTAYKDVERATGVTFGEAFLQGVLEQGTQIFSSEKPALAMSVFAQHLPTQTLYFAHDLQNAIYRDGLDLNDFTAYESLFEKYNLNTADCIAAMQDMTIRSSTFQTFDTIKRWGINGFPTVLLQTTDGQYFMIARGFVAFDNLNTTIEKVLAEIRK